MTKVDLILLLLEIVGMNLGALKECSKNVNENVQKQKEVLKPYALGRFVCLCRPFAKPKLSLASIVLASTRSEALL